VEPGRAVVADAGVLVATVLAVLRRGDTRWVYLDAGVFSGLVETLDEAIRYRITTSADGGTAGPCVLAGPTCDSADVLYQRTPVHLPLELAEGDTVRLMSAGAYTSCYSTVGFNGFAPMPTRIIG
jgi:ornithine decarboxylase